jgi:hypothetical protein
MNHMPPCLELPVNRQPLLRCRYYFLEKEKGLNIYFLYSYSNEMASYGR